MAHAVPLEGEWCGAREVLKLMLVEAAENPREEYIVREYEIKENCTIDDVKDLMSRLTIFGDNRSRFFNHGGYQFLLRVVVAVNDNELRGAHTSLLNGLMNNDREGTAAYQQTMAADVLALIHDARIARQCIKDIWCLDASNVWRGDFRTFEAIARTHPQLASECVLTLGEMAAPASRDQFEARLRALQFFLTNSLARDCPWADDPDVLDATLAVLTAFVARGECPSEPLFDMTEPVLDAIDVRESAHESPLGGVPAAAMHLLVTWLSMPFSPAPYRGGPDDSRPDEWTDVKPCYVGRRTDIACGVNLRLGASNGVARIARWLVAEPMRRSEESAKLLEMMLYPYLVELYMPEEGCPRLAPDALAALDELFQLTSRDRNFTWSAIVVELLKYYYANMSSLITTPRAWAASDTESRVATGYVLEPTRLCVAVQCWLWKVNSLERRVLELCETGIITRATHAGDREILERILSARKSSPEMLALKQAIIDEREDLLETLINSGGRVNDFAEVDKFNEVSPLHLAVLLGRISALRFIIACGAASANDRVRIPAGSINARNQPVANDPLVLMVAIKQRPHGVVRELVALGADINAWDGKDNPLFSALYGTSSYQIDQRTAMGNLLLDLGANACVVSNGRGLLSTWCDVPTMERLIAHGADVNQRERPGKSPLMMALTEARRDCAQLLIDYGAAPPDAEDMEVLQRALWWNLHEGDLGWVQPLHDYGVVLNNPNARLQELWQHFTQTHPRDPISTEATKVTVLSNGELLLLWSARLHPFTPRVFQASVRTILLLRCLPATPRSSTPASSAYAFPNQTVSAAGGVHAEGVLSSAAWATLPMELIEEVIQCLYQATLRDLRASAPRLEREPVV